MIKEDTYVPRAATVTIASLPEGGFVVSQDDAGAVMPLAAMTTLAEAMDFLRRHLEREFVPSLANGGPLPSGIRPIEPLEMPELENVKRGWFRKAG